MTPQSDATEKELKPVMQTVVGKNGNCYAACLATWFGISIESVPVFDPTDNEKFWKGVRGWLEARGYAMLHVPFKFKAFRLYNAYLIVSGPSPRLEGIEHACIYKGEEPIHDPHPDGNFFAGKEPTEIDLIFPLHGRSPNPSTERLIGAARDLLANKSKSFGKKNDRYIEDESGELCYIVGHEAINALEIALEKFPEVSP